MFVYQVCEQSITPGINAKRHLGVAGEPGDVRVMEHLLISYF